MTPDQAVFHFRQHLKAMEEAAGKPVDPVNEALIVLGYFGGNVAEILIRLATERDSLAREIAHLEGGTK